MVINADRRPNSEHLRRYYSPKSSGVSAIVLGSENGECGGQDILLHRRRELDADGNEVLYTISVSNHPYDGRLFILPSTHVGGERYMCEQVHDVKALSKKIGHQDLFATITSNPDWREIRKVLFPGQIPQDRRNLSV